MTFIENVKMQKVVCDRFRGRGEKIQFVQYKKTLCLWRVSTKIVNQMRVCVCVCVCVCVHSSQCH